MIHLLMKTQNKYLHQHITLTVKSLKLVYQYICKMKKTAYLSFGAA